MTDSISPGQTVRRQRILRFVLTASTLTFLMQFTARAHAGLSALMADATDMFTAVWPDIIAGSAITVHFDKSDYPVFRDRKAGQW